MSRLVVVSNRVALPKEIRAGGLATAMHAALSESGGVWFGWSGKLAATSAGEPRRQRDGLITYATLDLSRRDHDDYYAGFANRALWPLFHCRTDLVDYRRETYAGYQRVNALFAEHLAALLQPDDVVWVHDYHLIPLAAHLRRRGVACRIGFFLHTPLPPADLLVTLPRHRELIESLAAYDLVGLQTPRDLRALQDYFCHESGAELADDGTIRMPEGRRFRADCFPIGIDTAAVAGSAARAAAGAAVARLRESLAERALVIGVDRLDYSKGLPERFSAFGRLLETAPHLRSRVSLLQIAPPSRSEVPEYRAIRRELERIAGHINGAYAEPDWVPIRYVNKAFPQATLAGYYRTARVGLVTPLRDGMNLVAKEYVACQDPADPGVLVLSRFAGAANELKTALRVNPYDQDEVADALRAALVMPLEERRARWQAMMDVMRQQDITAWRGAFLRALAPPSQAERNLHRVS
ncbi:trehalose-6-phosphate synthase [Mizugakiibacter sediminis]|uniref:Trehalose-6-phosphate synthase n=1 Tax=Mizugakiibacter sediminis TaxID=1475481 RepID=A0A0K8QJM7_9GAMM|nr:alpha,alpha-trehalose-phosphate synthase (UDP-forming) [Mizugakiibacter sediminis]GAP65068.1 trehalose-6-phosphate synthase [Mizugakiibacter sediminis]